ncbi:MAG: flagellar basal body-associated FliL family protein [Thermodesulfovibrionales bacterium]|jgi:flagellar FliL protein
MADEKQQTNPEETKEQAPKKGNKNMLIMIIAGSIILAVAAGFITYTQFIAKGKGGEAHKKEETKYAKAALVSLDPFVMNLAEQGRFLKVSMQFELTDLSYEPLFTDKIPQIRDSIITLMSSKSAESVSSPEGKFQLKDELLLRTNQAIGKDILKNLYFTEFVMQ